MTADPTRFNPRKLLHSKWTARAPQKREKHFMVTACHWNDDETELLSIELQAVLTGNCYPLEWRQLRDSEAWLQGWK
ncbi:MAG TPA: TIGR02450 family Trp-rich protein [Pseudomonas sabulinigri]|uniref:TIGR02450 family Trp-rich protein n=1 Tax=marine sediment metagenome TaxID=412755 RepID=A0A0F9WJB0_9ZZZZ|nr:TIGR02450 family Trp-rich protein [Halopseudomonas sabulinigri]HEC52674.1 TIGR02450 family Trp-rich protein [Halopseudomonas sabulinigri]